MARRPWRILFVWGVLAGILGLFGLGLADKISNRPLLAEGTASKRAYEIATREFGKDNAVVVLLRGPRGAVAAQGRELGRRLETMPDAVVISPWSPGAPFEGLAPSPGVAGLIVNVDGKSEDETAILPPLERRIAAVVHAPVTSSVAGGPVIANSFLNAASHAATRGEMIAIPLLMVILLFVFRSVIAAAMPVVVGGAVVGATRGVLDLIAGLVYIDSFALGAVGMLGLALGVDYSLLMVSRYREEIGSGLEPEAAMRRTVVTTGPTVAMAGLGLSLALLVAAQLLPSAAVNAMAIAVIVAATLSVLSALLVVPAMLILLGPQLERWALPRRSGRGGLAWRWTGRAAVRPRLAFWVIGVTMVAAAIWAFTLDTRVGAVEFLPPDDPGRIQHEDVRRALGPGWGAPYQILVNGGDEPITTRARLRELVAFQRRVERDPGVVTMNGFAAIQRGTSRLSGLDEGLSAQQAGLKRLDSGLSRVEDGAVMNTRGLSAAAGGAGQLDAALGATHDGAGLLVEGMQAASTGSEQLAGGLARVSGGSGELADGAVKASSGADRLAGGLARAREQMGETASSARLLDSAMGAGEERLTQLEVPIQATEARLANALTALRGMTVGRSDPQFRMALEQAEEAIAWLTGTDPRSGEAFASSAGANTGIDRARGQFSLGSYLARRQAKNGETAAEGVAKLAESSTRLDRGLVKLASSSQRIDEAVGQLSDGGQALSPALDRLDSGLEHLSGGLGSLKEGSGQLAGALGGGAERSKLLSGALDKIDDRVARQRGEGGGLSSLRERSPGMFDSGYFYLASLDGGSSDSRRKAGFLVSLERGGHTARMMVIPRHAPTEDGAAETRERIEGDAELLAERTGTDVVVGGLSAVVPDLDSAFSSQSTKARVAMALVTVVILLLVLRSLPMAVIAALLNLLTVATTFGVLALLFDGSLLGGPGYVDTAVVPVSVVVIFALAIDYEVFLFGRMREEHARTGSSEEAIANSLERTAPVITGAALIMIAVFLAFATTSFTTIRNFGVAEAVAVFIDAFVVRLILVPAIMRMLGEKAWWMPRWLDRLLPGGSLPVEGAAGRGAA